MTSIHCKYSASVSYLHLLLSSLGGDFNWTEDEVLDWNHAEPHPSSQPVLKQLVFSHGEGLTQAADSINGLTLEMTGCL